MASLITNGQDTARLIESKPFVLGQINEIQSKILAEKRVLNIYLPVGYNQNDTIKYSVIYLLDGSADEDFIHIAGLVQFSTFPWVNTLPKSILVGIANVDRRRDFTFPTTIEQDKKNYPTTGGSANFITFIENELQPFIEKNYKTDSVKTIIGESLGGLLATEILLKKPRLFTNYIIVSPSLWWDKESLLTKQPVVVNKDFAQPTFIYLAVGNEGDTMINDMWKLAAIFKKGNQIFLHVNAEYLSKEDHGTILHQAVYDAIQIFNKERIK